MRLRNVANAYELVNNNKLVIKENIFDDKKKLHIEIGCGKGDFIIGMSKKHPDINFIGIEKYESVLIRALEKLDEVPNNLRFMLLDASGIDEKFSQNVNCIYLNFSDPWPKKRHAKRRLTSPIFLEKYAKIANKRIEIIQKTDNIALFAYSLMNYNNEGFKFLNLTMDLLNSEIDNIMTEYETKFVDLGVNINYVHVIKDILN